MEIKELENKKQKLLKSVNELVLIKKKLYSNMDIESPMSEEEKILNKRIANLFSEIDQIVREKRKLLNLKI